MAGYNKAGVYSGLMRALREDTALQGMRTGVVHALLTSPVCVCVCVCVCV